MLVEADVDAGGRVGAQPGQRLQLAYPEQRRVARVGRCRLGLHSQCPGVCLGADALHGRLALRGHLLDLGPRPRLDRLTLGLSPGLNKLRLAEASLP